MPEKPPIAVACAAIQRDGRVLIARRPAHKHLGLKWEFPGGKLEPGEPPADALVREIREELGCEVENLHALPSFLHDYGSILIAMSPFLCRLTRTSPEPIAHEHAELRWVRPAELSRFDLAAADFPVVAAWKSLRPDDFASDRG